MKTFIVLFENFYIFAQQQQNELCSKKQQSHFRYLILANQVQQDLTKPKMKQLFIIYLALYLFIKPLKVLNRLIKP